MKTKEVIQALEKELNYRFNLYRKYPEAIYSKYYFNLFRRILKLNNVYLFNSYLNEYIDKYRNCICTKLGELSKYDLQLMDYEKVVISSYMFRKIRKHFNFFI